MLDGIDLFELLLRQVRCWPPSCWRWWWWSSRGRCSSAWKREDSGLGGGMALGAKFNLENLLKMLQGGRLFLRSKFRRGCWCLELICVFQLQITSFREADLVFWNRALWSWKEWRKYEVYHKRLLNLVVCCHQLHAQKAVVQQSNLFPISKRNGCKEVKSSP